MSLEIDTGRVKQVLMWHWHDVIPGTFELGAYDYAGLDKTQFPVTAGATWRERNEAGHERIVFCPSFSLIRTANSGVGGALLPETLLNAHTLDATNGVATTKIKMATLSGG